MKIRTRLTLQFASIFALILLLFSLVVYYFTSIYRQDDFYRRISRRALILARHILEADEVDKLQQRRNQISYFQELPFESVRIINADGDAIFSEGEGDLGFTPARAEKIRQEGVLKYEEGVRQVVGMYYQDNQGDYIILASSIDAYSLRKLHHLEILLLVGFFGSMAVVLVAGWIFSKQAMRPIIKVISEVQKISASDLHLRLSDADGKDEISHLAQTFNRMLDRLELAFEMQSTFVSNASHELRTPLTAMIGELEVALMKPREATEYHRVLQSALEEARMLTELSNGLLQIAQASLDPSKIKLTTLRFDELVWMARDQVLKRQPKARIDIDFANFPEEEDRLVVRGNEALLLVAVVNVLENAIKFSPNEQAVVGRIVVRKNEVMLQVRDRGLGIAPDDLKHVFVPFFRAENVRSITGHGIGLPLAERILKLHKGAISVDSRINEGTEVIISLPQVYLIIPDYT
ncbi:HAMP domain-containing sensor histidine kinase [Pontibacter akesuensis]|uniref:histidine kinase n=1 Tax=Pontibacter akesuensis TaxID=388950 RepID=A0A1I7KGV4_9BACT|nr:ATP-binding protein [Pontibacter akesuensis]GHA79228.1 two-component sensor histidine kinase [Pontibacter akesuensis]SFU96574.1 Signal transduction histidine kinase [Pontibacter akesuensis]